MEQRTLGSVGPVSVLTLGGGGLGQVWGTTTREECVATVREAAAAGVTLFDMAPLYGRGLEESLARMRLDRVDLFILHGQVVPDERGNRASTPLRLFEEVVRPAFEDLVRGGRIGAWGITAVERPGAVIEVIGATPSPAAVQCITNLLDSPGGMKTSPEPARPREIIAAAQDHGVGVMGIRAVAAGAL